MGMPQTGLAESVRQVESNRAGFNTLEFRNDPVAANTIRAVAASWPTPGDLDQRARDLAGAKVTMLRHTEGMLGCSLAAAEGRIIVNDDQLLWLPKGRRTRGYHLPTDRLLDLRPGWQGAVDALGAEVEAALAVFPPMEDLRQDHLAALPDESAGPPEYVGLTLFGSHRLLGQRVDGCFWLLTDYDPDEDIANGYLRVPDRAEFESEHGSIHGQDLHRMGVSVVVDPPAVTFAEALDLDRVDDATATRRVCGEPAAVAAQ